MERIPKPNEIYRHFKGNLYRIVTVAKHSETGEEMVVYQALYGDYGAYVRPLSMFVSEVDREKYPDVKEKYRFTRIPAVGEAAEKAGAVSEAGFTDRKEDDGKTEAVGCLNMSENGQQTKDDCECTLHPKLLAFLDADSYEEKLRILVSMQDIPDEQMIQTMAVSLDLEVPKGSPEEKFQELKNCLLTLEKYECSRLR